MDCRNQSLSEITTMRTGGEAGCFVSVESEAELKEALAQAREREMPVRVLGGGSNIVAPDEGLGGMVIGMNIRGVSVEKETGEYAVVTVGAGEHWDTFVSRVVERGWGGIENLSGIPGTVGAAPIQNIGAYGAEVKNVITFVRTMNVTNGAVRAFSSEECNFAYRDSFFKTEAGKQYVVTAVTFHLCTDAPIDISYADLARHFAEYSHEQISRAQVREAVRAIRARKFPPLDTYGCCGSFFKNPIVNEGVRNELVARYPSLPTFARADGRYKLSLAWILDKVCGLKGYTEGNVGLYEKQPLVVVNYGGATAREIVAFVEKVKRYVYEQIGVEVENEVELITDAHGYETDEHK